jgi:hypothetical protein
MDDLEAELANLRTEAFTLKEKAREADEARLKAEAAAQILADRAALGRQSDAEARSTARRVTRRERRISELRAELAELEEG